MSIHLRVGLVGKYPPIQGGVSKSNFWLARALADAGHHVHVISNSLEVEPNYRMYLEPDDLEMFHYRPEPDSGGKVVFHSCSPFTSVPNYIPWANPFVTKLSGMLINLIRQEKLDILYSVYLEPYAVAGHLASSLTGIPHIVKHAGSDFYSIRKYPDMAPMLNAVLTHADAVFTSPSAKKEMRRTGVKEERIVVGAGENFPGHLFHPSARPLNVNHLLQRLRELDKPSFNSIMGWHSNEFPAELPTIGIYGKQGETKGSYDLVKALGQLAKDGEKFNFLAMVGGNHMQQFRECVQQSEIEERTWLLPFLPHWKVPAFIRACTAVCFLERDFWLEQHAPGIPREIMSCGICLVGSEEALKKLVGARKLIDGENVYMVRKPQDINSLAMVLRNVIQNPRQAIEIGKAGMRVIAEQRYKNNVAERHEEVFSSVLLKRQERR